MSRIEGQAARDRIVAWGREIGFSSIGIAPADRPPRADFLLDWLRLGHHATMAYLARDPVSRGDPTRILDGCRSVVCVSLDYGGDEDPAEQDPSLGRISRYAWGDDYHDVLGEKLRALAGRIEEQWRDARTRIAVDTSPVLEKEFAALAGLGWIGKHTNLIDPRRGSWFLLGEIFTTLSLPPDLPVTDRCGTCVRCIEICPTAAIIEPYHLDAGRCLSYWSIEHRGEIPGEIQAAMGNWIFGCDLCQDVCPWNRKAPPAAERRLEPRPGIVGIPLDEWERLGAEAYRERFRGSAVKRARYDGFVRNVRIAARNARRDRAPSDPGSQDR